MNLFSGFATAAIVAVIGTLLRWGVSVERALKAREMESIKHLAALDALIERINGHEAVDDQREKRTDSLEGRIGSLEHAVAFSPPRR